MAAYFLWSKLVVCEQQKPLQGCMDAQVSLRFLLVAYMSQYQNSYNFHRDTIDKSDKHIF